MCVCVHACMLRCLGHVGLFCNPMDCSSPGSSVHGISQARVLECVRKLKMFLRKSFIQTMRSQRSQREQTKVEVVS